MKRIHWITWLASVLFVVSPMAAFGAPVQEGGTYVAVTGGAFVVWCSEDQHAIVPQGDPLEQDPAAWLFSGEPECLPSDAANAGREALGQHREPMGLGGYAWRFDREHIGTYAFARTDDVVSGPDTFMTLMWTAGEAEDQVSEGCGPQTILLTEPMWHFPVEPSPPMIFWAFIATVGVDADLDVCTATTGLVQASYGA